MVENIQYDYVLWVLEPQRKLEFQKIYGTDKVPVVSPWPIFLPGTKKLVVTVDPRFVTPEMETKVIELVHQRFQIPKEKIKQDIKEFGIYVDTHNSFVQCKNLFNLK